ncbi:unnamed protein product [Ectocarpus sp. 6 AP-2014]
MQRRASNVRMVGALKVVLPVLGVAQIVLASLYADPGFQKMVVKLLLGENSKAGEGAACSGVILQQLCPLYLGMAALNIWSWGMGSEIRPKVALANIFSMAGVLYAHSRAPNSSMFNSAPVWVSVAGLVAVVAGLVLHQLEPGLLTEDKASTTKARTARTKKNA